MYAFIQRRYIEAISYYKHAEHQLILVTDEIEKAEFYYKIAEVYYHMKQTYFSMHYAKKARDIYKKHQLYGKEAFNVILSWQVIGLMSISIKKRFLI